MKYGQIRSLDVANGPGIRVSIFTTGCTHNCYKCFNKEYQSFNYGENWTDATTSYLIKELKKDYIKGLSILGGEPMENAEDLYNIILKVKKEIPDLNIWLWSGYTFEDIIADPIKKKLLKEINVLVDGKFQNDKKDLTLKFRGSSNQRIINVKSSIKNNNINILDNY